MATKPYFSNTGDDRRGAHLQRAAARLQRGDRPVRGESKKKHVVVSSLLLNSDLLLDRPFHGACTPRAWSKILAAARPCGN